MSWPTEMTIVITRHWETSKLEAVQVVETKDELDDQASRSAFIEATTIDGESVEIVNDHIVTIVSVSL
jgi:hypothetical protein